MLRWEEFVEVRNLWERGWTISAIARHLGRDRKTIRRYLFDPEAQPGERKPVSKLIDRYVRYIAARLEDNPHLKGKVLLRELRKLGYKGSYRTLVRHLAHVRPPCPACQGAEPAEAVIMEHPPGSAQADWSPFFWTPAGRDEEVKIQLLGIELCRPRVLYAEFVERVTWAHLAWVHIAAFDYFGGTPTQIRYDRAPQLFRPGTTQPTAAFADFAAYYGFKPVAIPRGRPRTNGQIERCFGYVATSFFQTAEAATLEELNRQLRRWLDEVANVRTSEDIVLPPWEALQAERAHLLPVRRPPYPVELKVTRQVEKRSWVRLDGGRYSVEPGHVGARVEVVTRPGSEVIEIRRNGQLIGRHHRVPPGEKSLDPAHLEALQALTLASLHGGGGRHERKRNDGRVGPRAAEEAIRLLLERALGTDGQVQAVDLSRYDEAWKRP